ncbi:ribosome biogenesis GTP-binding protein YihA/YsxC [Flavobacteriaceae bacterium]|jgi:GTP-binding protein|nr:ribosome biogenesis GTP-binding protein YihA/YsxC [Flavobacteriaceae bacterium]
MKIKSAEFLVSNQDVAKCPQNKIPEYAFIGRSNVGKSSLINMLTNRKSLAKTSGKPGKTQLINHFIINNAWYLVDLPGYGYAKVSKSSKRIFQKFITEYFKQRTQLIAAFVLIDIRHKPQLIDLNFMEWLGSNQIPFAIVFTKVDKLNPKSVDEYLSSYKNVLLETWEDVPQYFVTSSSKSIGKKDLLSYIDSINCNITKAT